MESSQVTTTEVRIECPTCDNMSAKGRHDPVCYLNFDKGVYYCQRCHQKGKLEDLDLDSLNVVSIKDVKKFDSSVWDKLLPLPFEALTYMGLRFPRSNIKNMDLRYHPEKHAIAIPTRNVQGEVQGIKYRYIAPIGDLRYIAEEGSQFGGYWLEGDSSKLLITEGEFDAISAKVVGFQGTILSLQTNKLSQESINRVRSFKHVFLALDQDKAGAEGTKEIEQILFGHTTPTVLNLPFGKDLNEALQTDREALATWIQSETKTAIEKATTQLSDSITEMVEYLSNRRNTEGDSTGFRSLDFRLGGGLRPCEMTVINAFAKTGKTSFLNNLVHNLAKQGKKIALASFEMDPAKMLYPSLLSIAGKMNLRSISDKDLLKEAITSIQETKPYLQNIITFKRFGYTPWEEVEEWATLMKKNHNIDYLVLDHAGFMVSKMTDAEENQILAKNIKKLTNTLGIHIPVVVQAPKTKDGLSIQTSYGGLAWGMNSDQFIILERDKENESVLKVKLEAARYPGANPSSDPVLLFYDRENYTLSE